MAFRFRKSVKILPGVRINLGRRGISTTVGKRGASINVGKSGAFLNSSIPGTGLSARTKVAAAKPAGAKRSGRGPGLWSWLVVAAIGWMVFGPVDQPDPPVPEAVDPPEISVQPSVARQPEASSAGSDLPESKSQKPDQPVIEQPPLASGLAASMRPAPRPSGHAAPAPSPPLMLVPASPARSFYRSCAAARAAGAAPLRRDDPGYSRNLDRDGDGVACE